MKIDWGVNEWTKNLKSYNINIVQPWRTRINYKIFFPFEDDTVLVMWVIGVSVCKRLNVCFTKLTRDLISKSLIISMNHQSCKDKSSERHLIRYCAAEQISQVEQSVLENKPAFWSTGTMNLWLSSGACWRYEKRQSLTPEHWTCRSVEWSLTSSSPI